MNSCTEHAPQTLPRVVITGAGLVSALGLDRRSTFEAVVRGRCGVRPLTAIEQALSPNKGGGQAPDLAADFSPGETREVRYLKVALAEAIRDAGVLGRLPCSPKRVGLLLGTTLHGMRSAGEYLRKNDFEPLRSFLAQSTLARSAAELLASLPSAGDTLGFAATTCLACSSGLGSIALAVTMLQTGQLDLVIAGGYDTLSEYAYAGFNSLRLVAEGPQRPFTRERQGMKLAEGYGVLVLERAPEAAGRKADVLAEILGFGESADAHHLSQPHPEGDGAARAMEAALKAAGVNAAEVDLIAAHATATPDNDAAEYKALARVFGQHLPRVPVAAFKSHLGHTLGGAGAVELILTAMALRNSTVPPTVNVTPDAIEFASLRLATAAQPAELRTALTMSLGFGGANTCLIIRGPQQCGTGGPPASLKIEENHGRAAGGTNGAFKDVWITGVGIVLPGGVGNEAFAAMLCSSSPRQVTRDTGSVAESQIASLLNTRRVRRLSDYVKLSLAATALAAKDASVTDLPAFAAACSAILGTTHGSSNYCFEYYSQIVREGVNAANPLLFAEGVPNAAAAHLSLMFGLKGSCQTVIGSRTAGLDALRLAALRISSGQTDRVIVSAGEEYAPPTNAAYKHCGLYAGEGATAPFTNSPGFATCAGAVAFVLESRASAAARGARPRGSILAASAAMAKAGRETDAARAALADLGNFDHLLTSANGTCIDRIESAALRQVLRSDPRDVVVSALYGHTPELFSAGPLASIAAVLLSGRLPALFGPGPRVSDRVARAGRLVPAKGVESPHSFAVIATDYTGLSSAMLLHRASKKSEI